MKSKKKNRAKKVNYKKQNTGDRIIWTGHVFVTEDMLPSDEVLKIRLGELYPENLN